MSAKARDGQGRFRSQTIGVRVSPEENAMVNVLAELSGLTKQDYVIQSVLNHRVIVVGSSRVHKALRGYMEQLYLEFQRLCDASQINSETLEVLRYLAAVYDGLQS